MPEPKTLQEAVVYFSDPDRAFEFAKKLRWPDGNVVCPRCEVSKNSFIKTRRLWFCYACKRQFTIKVKTIMEDSPIGLDKWMTAFWLLANAKNGISSHELGRALGVTQTTAWFMLQRVREVMKKHSFDTSKIGGEGSTLEADETFVGGVTKNMHKASRIKAEGRGPYKNKTIVQGILDRNLRKVRAAVVPNVTRETLQNAILKNVNLGAQSIRTARSPMITGCSADSFTTLLTRLRATFADKSTSTAWKISGRSSSDLCAAPTLLWNLFISHATLTNKFFVTTTVRTATAS